MEPRLQASATEHAFTVETAACLRCAACSSLAPGLIEMQDDGAHVARQPSTAAELAAVTAALLNCPASAIRKAPKAR
jgi:ferredoxin